jgi:hypothetical protein
MLWDALGSLSAPSRSLVLLAVPGIAIIADKILLFLLILLCLFRRPS